MYISDITHSIRSLVFTITIENLLSFLEYFDGKIISINNFLLGFVKVWSTHLYFVFLHKCGKILKRKERANILRDLESCHVASKSSLFQVSSLIKCYRCCADDRVQSCSSKTAEENKENIKLNVSPNRQNIK